MSSAYGNIFPYCATLRVLLTPFVGAAHTRVRHVAGVQGKTSRDRFPAPSASVSFATPTEMERGVKGDEVVHFTLDALNRPNTHRRGRWIGFATCPCGLASESGVGAKPQGLVFCF